MDEFTEMDNHVVELTGADWRQQTASRCWYYFWFMSPRGGNPLLITTIYVCYARPLTPSFVCLLSSLFSPSLHHACVYLSELLNHIDIVSGRGRPGRHGCYYYLGCFPSTRSRVWSFYLFTFLHGHSNEPCYLYSLL